MGSFFNARGANFFSVAVRKGGPLEIGVAPCFICRVVFSAQKVSFYCHDRTFAACWTYFHKFIFKPVPLWRTVGIHASIKTIIMQGLNLIFSIAILVISVVVHEVSHGYAAYLMGDHTAKRAGRLTMNPLKHLDLMGSFIVPVMLIILRSSFVFGWAKPVPYNPYNLKNQKWGPGIVGLSGPLSNFLIAGVFSFMAMILPLDGSAKSAIAFGAIGNLGIPAGDYAASLYYFSSMVIWINVFLGIFNLIPIPPLDGSKVLFAMLPYRLRNIQEFLEKYGFFFLIIFLFSFSNLILPIVLGLYRIFLGV